MIIQIRKSIYAKIFSFLLLASMVCYTNQGSFAKARIVSVTDNKDIFRALFFLDGSLLDRLPNLQVFRVDKLLKTDADLSKYREHVNTVLSQIEARDASFFSRFATEVTSGNQLRIKKAMDLGARELEAFYKEDINKKFQSPEYKKASTDFKNYLEKNGLPTDTYQQKADAVQGYFHTLESNTNLASVTIVLAAAIVALLVIVVTVAIAVDGLFWDGTPANRMFTGKGLVNEEIVNEIAVNFNGIIKKA